ncbi:carboxymuconolactone decarboxylase family protein [Nocardioides KLBMP 9356]|uniref:Carboxymuconolactone decarboxylase family protein n=1 Tax=Nocardioides potassii TaxID=2911371 RepID=A0ABS9H9H1_9ACTN|nr:carboxymuconolactone decarboxylase family protein [Nocardioides potassii]MCF6377861.1 carboxymuconolactone decarboxylase family protein [Nocardioides potassii]
MRLPDLAPEDLDPEQRALYDAIVGGPRGTGTQHFPLTTRGGALTGPFGVMVHGPALGRPLQELGSALRYATGLSDRLREIAILTVAGATRSEFERYAHERVGRAAGLSDDELAALADGSFTSLSHAEQTAYDFCRRLLDGRPRLGNEEYADLVAVLGTTTITELTVLVGYYRTLSDLMAVYDVGAPEEQQPGQ